MLFFCMGFLFAQSPQRQAPFDQKHIRILAGLSRWNVPILPIWVTLRWSPRQQCLSTSLSRTFRVFFCRFRWTALWRPGMGFPWYLGTLKKLWKKHRRFVQPFGAKPLGSMYMDVYWYIFSFIYHKNPPNVGKYTVHGSSGFRFIIQEIIPCFLPLLPSQVKIIIIHYDPWF